MFSFVYFSRVRSSLQGSLLATLPDDVAKFYQAHARLPSDWQEYARWHLASSPDRSDDLARTLESLVQIQQGGACITNLSRGTPIFSLRQEGRKQLEDSMNQSFWNFLPPDN